MEKSKDYTVTPAIYAGLACTRHCRRWTERLDHFLERVGLSLAEVRSMSRQHLADHVRRAEMLAQKFVDSTQKLQEKIT
jgi:hypothetical protein